MPPREMMDASASPCPRRTQREATASPCLSRTLHQGRMPPPHRARVAHRGRQQRTQPHRFHTAPEEGNRCLTLPQPGGKASLILKDFAMGWEIMEFHLGTLLGFYCRHHQQYRHSDSDSHHNHYYSVLLQMYNLIVIL